MADHRTTRILGSKTNMSPGEIEQLTTLQAWKVIYAFRQKREKDERLQVCFTGFNDARKIELKILAENRNFKVVTQVTKSLDFLCSGGAPGPAKIAKAEAQGVPVISEQQFLQLAHTGEVPVER